MSKVVEDLLLEKTLGAENILGDGCTLVVLWILEGLLVNVGTPMIGRLLAVEEELMTLRNKLVDQAK